MLLLARREVVQALRSRGWRVLTAIVALSVAAINVIPALVANREDSFDVGLSQELSEELVQSIEAIGEPLDAEV
jgi:hypothetical protein